MRAVRCEALDGRGADRDRGAFDLTATDIYGLSEIMGPGVAQDFAGDRGPTSWEDHFLPEIVDPETGEPLPDGEEGGPVFTSPAKQALSIIRFARAP